MVNQQSLPHWWRIWERSCLIVAAVGFLIPALGLLLFGPYSNLRFVAFLFVGLAGLGARSSMLAWFGSDIPQLRHWVLAGVLTGTAAAVIGSSLRLVGLWNGTVPITALSVLALLVLSLVHMRMRSGRQTSAGILLTITLLNGIIACAGGYEIASTLVRVVVEVGILTTLATVLLAAVCGAGIGGWRYVI
jgi:hypothetical protein